MVKNTNIKQVLKIMLLVLSVVFMLAACERQGSASGEAERRSALPAQHSEQTDEISKSHRECWQTGMITMLYDNMGKVAMGMYARITDGALPLMMVAFALWTSFRLLKHLGSMSEESPAEVWNEIVRKLFVCLVCGYIASSTVGILWILNTIIFPIYYAFLELGGSILSTTGDGSPFKVTSSNVIEFFQEKMDVSAPVLCKATGMGQASLDAFPTGPKEMMNCMICAINERLSLGFSLSFAVMAGPGFMSFITGFLILLCFTFVKLGFVFYLVDSIFRFTIIATILPILVMSYAFKQTSSWAKQGFETILNSAALMMFMAVMMAMALLAMEQIISDNSALFNGQVSKQSFAEFSVPFMCIMMIGFLIVSSVGIAQQITDKLVGGNSDSPFQKRAGKLAASIFGKLLKSVTSGSSKAAGKIVKRILFGKNG